MKAGPLGPIHLSHHCKGKDFPVQTLNLYGRLEIQLHSIITPVLHGNELLASCVGRLIHGNSQQYPLKGEAGWVSESVWTFRRIETSLAAAGSRLHFLDRPARSPVTIPAELSRLLYWWCICAREVWLQFIVLRGNMSFISPPSRLTTLGVIVLQVQNGRRVKSAEHTSKGTVACYLGPGVL